MPPRSSSRSKAKQLRLFASANDAKTATSSVKSGTLENPANGSPTKHHTTTNNPIASNSSSLSSVIGSEESPEAMISEILKLLQLSYDSNVGMLAGDLVFINNSSQLSSKLTTPMLVNLKNLVKQLKKSLKFIGNEDTLKILKLKGQTLKDNKEILFTKSDLDFIKLHELDLEEYGITFSIQQSILESSNNTIPKLTDEKEIIAEDTSLMALETKKITKGEEQVIESVEKEVLKDPNHKRSATTYFDASESKRVKTEGINSIDGIASTLRISTTTALNNQPADVSLTPLYAVAPLTVDPIMQDMPKYFDTRKFLNAAKKLHLFEANGELEEKKDPEYLKEFYGVTAYPKDFYLRDYLTGDIPDTDFSVQKDIKNKVNFNNFLTFTDNYFRNFDDKDLVFLKRKHIYSPGLDTFYQSIFSQLSSSLATTPSSDNQISSSFVQNASEYDPKVYPFLIPKLGKHYSKVWAEEDSSKLSNYNKELTEFQQIKDSLIPKSSGSLIDDTSLNEDLVSCGPLVSRLMAAILPEKEIIENFNKANEEEDGSQDRSSERSQQSLNTDFQDDSNNDKNSSFNNNNEDSIYYVPGVLQSGADSFNYSTLEDRLKRELKFVGIYLNYKNEVTMNKKKLINVNGIEGSTINSTNNVLNVDEDVITETFEEAWVYNKQDDEVSRELRALQSQLKVVNMKNNYRKVKLFKRLYEEISFREFYNILENLNKQIDQYYAKKQKVLVRYNKRHHKKHTSADDVGSSNGSLSHQQVIDKTLNSLIEKRDKWIEKIGPLFNYRENIQLRNLPNESIFNPKISKINEDNFDDFYEVYSKFFGDLDNEDYDDDEDDEEKIDKSSNGDGILLSDDVRIKKDELKLKESMKEIDLEKNISSIQVLELTNTENLYEN